MFNRTYSRLFFTPQQAFFMNSRIDSYSHIDKAY